jgi:hypothetical protein
MAKVFKLSVVADAAITSYVKGKIGQEKKDGKLLDILQAEGVVSGMLVAPEKGADRTVYDGILAAIIMGFEANKQKLLASPTKGMSDSQKKAKFKVQQSVGGWMGTLKRDLVGREAKAKAAEAAEAAEAAGEEVEKEAKSTFESRLKRDLTKYIAQIEKLEGAQFAVVDMLKYLKSASALIK